MASICVFAGARCGHSPAALQAATELGRLLGHHGHRLIYGAGGAGMMGALAWSAAAAGAPITGVIPAFLHQRERAQDAPVQDLVVTADLAERKQRMLELADAFVALPGGYGTLDEILEVISARYLGLHDKPMILLDVDGIWAGLLALTRHLHQLGYAEPEPGALLHLAATSQQVLDLLHRLPEPLSTV
ncbi:TIGR00730 family Rossman fold protein [Nonomuraea sp. AD125B]|uniref:LOG family protein n=1 Tax=Nonomuraea sp. AD125B TaxID=3242897 RepID=UPI0035298BD6